VFNVWQAASLGMSERVQAVPQQVTSLLPELTTTTTTMVPY
jgi:hypothetical protein